MVSLKVLNTLIFTPNSVRIWYETSLVTGLEAVLKCAKELRYWAIVVTFLLWYVTNAE
jgi:hypothetical protein